MCDTSSMNVLIGCSGSVATIKLPELLKLMKDATINNHPINIKVVLTESSKHFVFLDEVKLLAKVYTDEDEWSAWQMMSDPVLHIELRKWADVLVIAPLSANTMAKLANGLCDNLLTCIVRAWDMKKPLLFCPAMNTHMWDHPITRNHVSSLTDIGYKEVPCVSKKLACGEFGNGGMASVETIVAHTLQVLQENAKFKKDFVTRT